MITQSLDTVSYAFTFETISPEQLRTVAGGGENPPATWKYQGKTNNVSPKDQAKQDQALGQGAIWGTAGAVGALAAAQPEAALPLGAIGFAAGYFGSLWGSYGPGSS